MATKEDIVIDKETLLCSICLETFTLPRTLPCLHSFCHRCLKEHIRISVKTVNHERGFSCAVCRKFTPAPVKGLHTQQWAAHFPQNFTLVSILDSSVSILDSSKNVSAELKQGEHSCDPCSREDITVTATSYCLECAEKMCKTCQRHHRTNKTSSNHVYRNINESEEHIRELNFIQNLTKCLKHPSKKMKYFCKDHNESICGDCTALIHRRCEYIVSLAEKAKSCTKDSPAMMDIIEKLEAHADLLIGDEEKQLTSINKAEGKANARMAKLKKKMFTMFEELNRRTMEKIDNEHEDISVKTIVRISAIEAIKHKLKVSRKHLDGVKAYGNKGYMFLYAKQLEKDLTQVSEDLQSLQKSLKREEIVVDVKEDLTEMMNWVSVRRKTIKLKLPQAPDYRLRMENSQEPQRPDFRLHTEESQLPQRPDFRLRREVHSGYRPGKERDANFKHQISTQFSHIRSCVWKDETQVFLCEGYSSRQIAAYEFTTSSTESTGTFNCPSYPVSMVKLDASQMAVSCPLVNIVQILNTSEPPITVVREIKIQSKPQSLAYNSVDKHLLVQSLDGAIRYVRSDGTDAGFLPLTHTTKQAVQNTSYIAFNSSIKVCYLACSGIHKVVAIDQQGRVVFDYSHESLRYPFGISLGPDDDIFVCSQGGNSIHQLSPSGQLLRQLLKEDEDVIDPWIISFNDHKDQFAVTCLRNTTIRVYDFVYLTK